MWRPMVLYRAKWHGWTQVLRRDTDMNMRLQSLAASGPRTRVETMLDQLAGPWWMFLVTGISWLVLSLIVLRFRITSVVAVGLGVLLPCSVRDGAGCWAVVSSGVFSTISFAGSFSASAYGASVGVL